jgi:TadE-like protein
MVEFALVAPVLLLLMFGLVDASRIAQSAVTVAAAARDGARQAVADAAAADMPFASAGSGACPGVSLTTTSSGTGCLTDARVAETVSARLSSLTSSVTVYPGTRGDVCPPPSMGSASICIDPEQSGPAAFSSCAAARASLGHDPGPGDLGGRQAEWTSRAGAGCFLVQVTVVYAYSPMTPAIGRLLPSSFLISSSTTLLAEY